MVEIPYNDVKYLKLLKPIISNLNIVIFLSIVCAENEKLMMTEINYIQFWKVPLYQNRMVRILCKCETQCKMTIIKDWQSVSFHYMTHVSIIMQIHGYQYSFHFIVHQ